MTAPAETETLRTGAPLAFAALVVGAIAMGMSPIFVRLADVGPFTSAFWRVCLALPILYLWALRDEGGQFSRITSGWLWPTVIAGVLFAGDLFFWHLSILTTTVANATFFATMAPVFVLLVVWLFFGERIARRSIIGLGFCLAGGAMLIGASMRIAPERLVGDGYGLVTAMFFAGYIIALGIARARGVSAGKASFQLTVVCAAILFVIAVLFEDQFFPQSAGGWAAVIALAVITHVGGQGLLAYALGHLPASYSSLVMFLEGVAAAILGWLVLSEALTLLQCLGAAAIFYGVFHARPRQAA